MWKLTICVCLCVVAAVSQGANDCTKNRQSGEIFYIESHAGLYRGNYPNNFNCSWTISTRRGQVVFLYFSHFSLQPSEGCTKDRITIFDGPNASSPEIKKLCGRKLPRRIYSTNRSVTIRFTTDASINDNGFMLIYDFVTKDRTCNTIRHLNDEEGEIISHSGLGRYHYASFLDCKWLISGRPGRIIRLYFEFFSVEALGCNFDSVTVYDGPDEESKVIKKLCGSTIPEFVSSTSQKVMIRFRTDSGMTSNGFRIRYKVIKSDETCPENLLRKDLKGVIHSHYLYPRITYANDMNCTWIIFGRPNKIVRLRFDQFRLQSCSDCECDVLTIYDGEDDKSPVLKTLCGDEMPRDIESVGQSVTLRFETDSSYQDWGFSINYEIVEESLIAGDTCPGNVELSDEKGVILSHAWHGRFPHANNINCTWFIVGRPNTNVRLSFERFRVQPCEDCDCDSLSIYDGPDFTSPLMQTLCGYELPKDIESTGESLFLSFESDSSQPDWGFRINYELIDKSPTAQADLDYTTVAPTVLVDELEEGS